MTMAIRILARYIELEPEAMMVLDRPDVATTRREFLDELDDKRRLSRVMTADNSYCRARYVNHGPPLSKCKV